MGRLWTLKLVWWFRSTCWTADHNAHFMQASRPLASGAADADSTLVGEIAREIVRSAISAISRRSSLSYFSTQIWVRNSSRNSRNSSEIARNSSRLLFLGFSLRSHREIAEIADLTISRAISPTSAFWAHTSSPPKEEWEPCARNLEQLENGWTVFNLHLNPPQYQYACRDNMQFQSFGLHHENVTKHLLRASNREQEACTSPSPVDEKQHNASKTPRWLRQLSISMAGKKLIFLGDSVSYQHWLSFICLVRASVERGPSMMGQLHPKRS